MILQVCAELQGDTASVDTSKEIEKAGAEVQKAINRLYEVTMSRRPAFSMNVSQGVGSPSTPSNVWSLKNISNVVWTPDAEQDVIVDTYMLTSG